MESRFAHLRQRDTSVSMLRVKVSRRRSQSQKANRERTVNTRRQLGPLAELENSSHNVSAATVNLSTTREKQNNAKFAPTVAQEERLKRLERWKEQKALEKEKENRARERKGVFKTGVFHPKDTFMFNSLPAVPPAVSRPKEKMNAALYQNTRVLRSMKQQQQEPQKPLAMQNPNTKVNGGKQTRTRAAPVKPAPAAAKSKVSAGYAVVAGPARASSTRSASKTLVTKDGPKPKAAGMRTTRSTAVVKPLPPSAGEVENCKAVSIATNAAASKEPELGGHQTQEVEKSISPEVEDMMVDHPPEELVPAGTPSFAPKGFVFKAPAGLLSFNFEPMTPRSADSFLTPSSSFIFPPVPTLNDEARSALSEPTPPEAPLCPPCSAPSVAPPTPGSSSEPKHDVAYFRLEIANEMDRLTSLCLYWESKVEDESIPEEMRDRMRTAVGQARLLMKERFKQFGGLVDDCELGRGEKVTTCMDLQGFWDMVFFQVEDVNKKFDALKELEGRGWVEEHKPPPRQRKMKKPPAAAPKPAANKTAAKSRLAAAKAAMKAKQQQEAEAETAAEDPVKSQELQLQTQGTVAFDGVFKVESPAKPSVRRSSRLSAVVLPPASPCSLFSPRRVSRRSRVVAQTPARPICPPENFCLALEQTPAPKSQRGTPQTSHSKQDMAHTSLCFSPVNEVPSEELQSKQNLTQRSECVSMEEDVLINSTADKIEDIRLSPRRSPSPCQTPSLVLQAPEPPPTPSFTPSPIVPPAQTPVSSPVQFSMQTPPSTDASTVEELPGLDIERYLQPSQRCSMSPVGADVEMESPSSPEELLVPQEPAVSSVLAVPSCKIQTAESDMLLFTPNPKDRIRPSVCPSDLMVFTPPSF
uniref:Discs, largehomolog-associated protein 5 n=1 Tax=Nothobranchius furzeri TaxID=105023 RepID=A0A1A8UU11_NOTFU